MVNQQYFWQIFLITCTTLVLCNCIEEVQPEIFLQPRNFNPHPYEAGYDPQRRGPENTGPVLFPETPLDPPSVGENAYATAGDEAYANVAKKRKYKLAGPYRNQEGKNYEFSYKVLDHKSGDDYSHRQSQDAGATKGEYRVKLPDGRVQIVSYTADKNGYNAEVTYEDEPYSQNKQLESPRTNSIDYHPRQKFSYYYVPTPVTSSYEMQNREAQNIARNEVDYITYRRKPSGLNSYLNENFVEYVPSTVTPKLNTYSRFTDTPKYNYL